MTALVAFNCDFCKKTGLKLSLANILYCPNCQKSYGEQMQRVAEVKG
jgi:ribosomal protein L37AE/L43A